MPDRILRAELLNSEAWLALKNNDDRVCWIVLLLNADTFGNQPAGPHRLVHIWRHAGVDTTEKAAKVLLELTEVDLCRSYTQADGWGNSNGKAYVHIPRFRQSRRYLGKLWPLSPWTTDQEKERLANKSRADHSESHESASDAPVGVGVGVGVGVDQKRFGAESASTTEAEKANNAFDKKKTAKVNNTGRWDQSDAGIMAKGQELGIKANPGETTFDYKRRLWTVINLQARTNGTSPPPQAISMVIAQMGKS